MRVLRANFVEIIFLLILIAVGGAADAEIRLASEWQSRTPEGALLPRGQSESSRLFAAASQAVVSQSAIPISERDVSVTTLRPGFQLFINETKFYIQPATFMAKKTPDEICHPVDFKNTPIYRCEEGQPLVQQCQLLFFDSNFQNVGVHELKVNVPFPYYCNAIPAVGTGDKKDNELLITVQYFAIDHDAAKKVSELGDGWVRQTILARVKVVDGKVELEQDDSCLGNPNTIDTIPDARAALKKCAEARH